jgi:hypothetical protein
MPFERDSEYTYLVNPGIVADHFRVKVELVGSRVLGDVERVADGHYSCGRRHQRDYAVLELSKNSKKKK